MVRAWQDYDPNCKATWGMWFGYRSVDGHIIAIVGPYNTKEDVLKELGDEQA